MKLRPHTFFDLDTLSPVYGVQVQRQPRGPWLNAAAGGKPLLYRNEADRDAKLQQLRQQQAA